ncbi:tRNA (adenosine(37)-N6)-dimethylallyltransferase MiaA [Oscillospiraceae bacterium OttesenSCG-928-F05]|nr:tRNA (adenosine(37)-N6)-dimethylallyltransferase MiaA [Oscillospiraceae bacterium OttesenSCG-928-F05]
MRSILDGHSSGEGEGNVESGRENRPKVVCVCGPTAAGKTALAVALAARFSGEIVSCDSMQIYRGLDIGTAKATPEERALAPHHMLDVALPEEPYSVDRFVAEASAAVAGILARGNLPVFTGGTGLYMEALLRGEAFQPVSGEAQIRQRLSRICDRFGGERMHRLLRAVDGESAAKFHPNDHRRVLRALEVYYETGRPLSRHNRETADKRRYTPLWIGVTCRRREVLYERINRRVDAMYAAGLAEEAAWLGARGGAATALQAIGYKEILRAVRAGGTPESASEEIKQASRRYAKRQLTWLRGNGEIQWLYSDESGPEAMLSQAEHIVSEFLESS